MAYDILAVEIGAVTDIFGAKYSRNYDIGMLCMLSSRTAVAWLASLSARVIMSAKQSLRRHSRIPPESLFSGAPAGSCNVASDFFESCKLANVYAL